MYLTAIGVFLLTFDMEYSNHSPMAVESFYDAISVINQKSEQLQNFANLGFYKVGKLLAKANDELGKGDWGKLRKKIAEKTKDKQPCISNNKKDILQSQEMKISNSTMRTYPNNGLLG